MKTPTACRSLEDVRSEIDRIDLQIVALLRQRADFVRTAAAFKSSQADVAAPARRTSMLEARRQWAVREGLDPDFIERLYGEIVAHFTSREMEHWKGGARQVAEKGSATEESADTM